MPSAGTSIKSPRWLGGTRATSPSGPLADRPDRRRPNPAPIVDQAQLPGRICRTRIPRSRIHRTAKPNDGAGVKRHLPSPPAICGSGLRSSRPYIAVQHPGGSSAQMRRMGPRLLLGDRQAEGPEGCPEFLADRPASVEPVERSAASLPSALPFPRPRPSAHVPPPNSLAPDLDPAVERA